jgi:hypothetical protein
LYGLDVLAMPVVPDTQSSVVSRHAVADDVVHIPLVPSLKADA